jgi:RHS repeat-associated protein
MDGQSNPQADYIYLGDQPIASVGPSTGNVYFLHDDRLGTPQAATDSNQTLMWSASYQPFGATSTAIGLIVQDIRLPGQEYDSATGWYHNGFREYVPGLGRYAQHDLLSPEFNSNVFAYARNNPVNRQDVFGLRDIVAAVWGSNYLGYLHGNGSVGHVYLGELNGDVILSQFPDPRGHLIGSNTTLDWTDTLAAEGRKPDAVFDVYVSDDYGFDTAVNALKADAQWYWNPKFDNSTNCTHAAYLALLFGGVSLNTPQFLPWTPNQFWDTLKSQVGKRASVARLSSIPWN